MSSFIQKINPLSKKKEEKKTEKFEAKVIREIRSLLVIIVVVFAFRSSFFEPFKIPSGSMIPTLMIGDFILVNKFSYGLKVPFSDMYGDPIYLFEFSKPKRGEVIVFKYPKDTSLNYIKRVIGLPGDTIEVIDKVVYVNNEALPADQVNDAEIKSIMENLEPKFQAFSLKFYKSKTGNYEHKTILWEDGYFTKNYGPRVVPEGSYLVMGDNRDFSADSRVWGFVEHRHIKGKALLVWFSMNLGILGSEHPTKFRPWRIGRLIH